MNEMQKLIKSMNNLRYDIGTIVYLKSDLEKKVPMTIINYCESDLGDYLVEWLNSQKKPERRWYYEMALTT